MKLANIVSNTKEDVSEEFNVVKSLDEIIQGLPTLIVGWDYIKANYPEYNMLERKLDNNLFWTFKKTEYREQHDEDIYNFSRNTYKNLVKNVKYYFFDFISLNNISIRKILKKLYISELTSYHYTDESRNIDMVYIYSEKIIFGIDLNQLEYIGFTKEKILSKIIIKSKTFLDENVIFIEYEKGIEFLDNKIKYLPFLYTIKNGKNNIISIVPIP